MFTKLRKSLRKFAQANVRPPGKYFISHSYGDAAIRDKLIENLPPQMEPVIFPPISVKPEEFVSNHLIEAILACDGLIYLRGGNSEKSFWVAFERDYALRAGMPVFVADPFTLAVKRDFSDPLDLATFASYSRKDIEHVKKIVEFLATERYFDIWVDWEGMPPSVNWFDHIKKRIEEPIQRGGYQIVFLSGYASRSKVIQMEVEHALKTAHPNTRTLFALLEELPMPEYLIDYHETAVQLYGNESFLDTHRLDDLVVRLYWLIYRNTRML